LPHVEAWLSMEAIKGLSGGGKGKSDNAEKKGGTSCHPSRRGWRKLQNLFVGLGSFKWGERGRKRGEKGTSQTTKKKKPNGSEKKPLKEGQTEQGGGAVKLSRITHRTMMWGRVC